MLSLRFVLLLTLFSALSSAVYGTGSRPPAGHHHEHSPTVRLSENKGQWPAAVRFRTRLPSADVWLENDGLRCMLYEPNIGERTHPLPAGEAPDYVKAHAYDLRWVDANPNVRPVPYQAYPDPEHYFIGNDPAQWASDVRAYKKVLYPEIWPGINLSMYGEGRSLKYDFYLNPGADPRNIRMRYSGLERLVVRDDRLELRTSVQTVEEQMPIAYQDLPGGRQRVACQYIPLDDSTVGFLFPDGYNPQYPVVIDPVLIFSTYTGSTSDNWGFTATYDEAGNLYSGGIVNGGGYPASTGAYQLTYSGGYGGGGGGLNYSCDMGLIKYSADGTQRLWATYVGGRHNEQPHSLVVNANNELFVLGSTRSNNFPTTPGALQTTLAGAYVTNATGDADIVVLRISATGAALQASTYVGGTGVDGLNLFENPNILYFFYADDARGEILLDGQSCIIASCTRSTNFPTTPGAFQTAFGGTQDACLFRLNASMSALEYSTYFGGTSYDAGYGVKIATDGSLYMVGGTISNNLPTTAGALNTAYQGGSADGFVFQFEANASTVRRGTYIGTNQYDQVYLIDLDARDNVYVAGQTTGAYPILNAPYNVAGGKQFITCLSSNLGQTRFSTRFGTGLAARTRPDITLTALLVDRCDNIYVAGWGAAGTGFRVRGENSGNTSNMPITADAYQSTTEGSDFYLMALYPDAGGLQYATFFGGPQSGDHVDGGTSRFDKRGVVYHSTCASCGTGSDFPTTAGAWSQINGSGNCNNASFKFNFDLLPELDARYTFDITTSSGCAPYTVQFNNGSTGTSVFYWDFGDGNHSTEANPTYTYNNPGEYTVRLVGIDANVCGLRDTVEQNIIVYARTTPDVTLTTVPCELGVTVTNNTVDGTSHHWDFGDGFESTLEHPAPHTYIAPGTYTVRYTVNPNSSCEEIWEEQITVGRRPVAGFTINYAGCTGAISFTNTSQTVDSGEYSWNFGDSNTSTAFQPTHTYTTAGNYNIRLIADPNGPCPDTLIRPVSIVLPPIAGAVSSNQTICRNRTPNLLTLSGHYQNIDRWEQSLDGVTWTTLSNTQATFQPPALTTTRHYRAIVSTPGCTPVASTPAVVTVDQTTVGFTINYAGCTGAISFTNTSQNVAGGSYSWNFGDGGTSTAFQPTHTYTVAGNYNIRLIADPNGQCPDTLIRPVTIILPPIAGAVSSNQTICRNRTPNLLTLSGHYQNVDRWEQSFDGVTWTTLSNTQATFQPPALTTTRHYRAIVSTPGCTPVASAPAVVTVNQTTVGFTINYAGCTGAISFTNTSQNVAGGSYSWNFGDGGTSTAFQPTHTYTVAGNYNIRLIADPNGQCPDTLIRPVSIVLPPIAGAVSSNQTICRNRTPNLLTLSGHYQNVDRWEQSLDGVTWTTLANTQATFQPPALTTTRHYRAIVSTPGCTPVASTPAIVTVDQTTVGFTINYAGCTGAISFTNTSQNVAGGSYSWNFGDGGTSTAFQPTHTYTVAGNYNIRLIADPNGQCPDTLIRPVSIVLPPIAGAVSSNQTICRNEQPNQLLLSGQYGTIDRWEESLDGVNWTPIANTQPWYLPPSLTTTRNYRAILSTPGCAAVQSTPARITVDQTTADFTINYAGCTPNISFTNLSQNVVGGYLWNFGDGNTSTAFQPTHSYVSMGTYNIRLIAHPSGQCPDTMIRPVTIRFLPIGGTLSSDRTVCQGSPGGTLSLSGQRGDVARWESSTDGATWTSIAHFGASYFVGPLSQTTWFRVVMTVEGCGIDPSTVARVQVDAPTIPGALPNQVARCDGETTIRIDLTGYQGQILRWERRESCDFGSWLPIASTDDFLLIEPFDGTACYRAVVKNGVCPEEPSNMARITNSTVIRSQLNYVDHVRCNGDGTGAIAHHVSGGLPPYTYVWSTGHTVEDIDGIDGGSHTVTVTDANGCTAVFSFTVYEPDSLDIVLNSLTPIRCHKGREGSIGVDVRGGTGPYSYFWNSAANDLQSTQENIDKLPAGVYRITVRDFNNCVATRTYTLTDPAPVQVTVTQAPSGSCDYMLTASVTGAQGSLASITWSNGEKTLRSSGWKPGDTWSVFIIDANGCAGAAFGKVTGPGPIRVDTSYIKHESCFGENDGAVGLVVLGGTPGYTFAWEELTRGFIANTEDLISQPAGSYVLTITDAAGCSKVHYIDIQGPKEALTATAASLRHVSCAGRADGDAALVVSGGTPPYSVVWNDGAQGLFRNNLAGGFYSAEVTDVNGCRVSVGLTIEEPEALRAAQTFIRHPECKGFATGSLSYDISGGKQDYGFVWSTGSTDENLTGLTAGVYSLTVTDAAGCTLVKRDTLTEPTALVITANTIAPPRCHDSADGAILVNVNGGVFPYQYAWTNGQNSQHATGLPSGTYTVYVTDVNGCQVQATYSLTAPPPLTIKQMAIRQPSCAGSTDGLIYVVGQGGASGYRYSWFKGQQFLRTGPIVYGLPAGGYRVEVVDFFGCTVSQGFTLTEPAPLSLTIESQNPTCSQAGQLSAITSGGTAPYTWLWSDNSTGNRLSIANGGPYNVSVRDANGCVISASVNVPNIPTLSLSVVSTKDIACRNGNDGVLEVAAASGKAPYTYKWSDNGTGARRTGLTAGWYSVTATDAEGCVGQMKDLQLTEPANGVNLQIDYIVPERCFGSRTGAIGIDTKGGTKPYTYAWSHGSVREDVSRLRKGTYTLTATDAKGCRSVLSVNVPGPDLPLTINAPVVQPERCNGRRDGLIVLDVRGGQGPYKYAWSQGGAGQAAVGLGAGTYSVIVTDAFGCTATRSFTLTSPPPLTLEFENVQQPGCDDRGRIEAKPSGGTGPYTYQWTNGGLQYMIDNLSAGAYSVIVRDAKGCTVTGTITLTASPPLYAKVISFKDARCGGDKNGSIGVDVWGGVQPYTYRWAHGPTVEDVSNLGAGLYTLDVTDAAGCVVSLSQVISEPPRLVVSTGAVVAPRCATSPTGAIGTNVAGGTSPYTYRWNHGPTTQDIRDLVAGTYGLLVRDSKGCFSTLRVNLTAPPCEGDDDGGGEPGSTREAAAREESGWQLAVYPNPAQDFVRLEVRGEGPQELTFTAYDLTGRRMLTGRMQNAAAVVDVRTWAPGVYVFRIETAPGVYESLQVLVGR